MNKVEKIDNILTIMTNLSGAGKTTVAKGILAYADEHNLNTHIIDEYRIFGKFINEYKDDPHLMTLKHAHDDNPNGHYELTPKGYKLVFSKISNEIIREFQEVKSSKQIVATEAARRIGGVSYYPLFNELVRAVGNKTKLVNLNIVVNDQNVLMERVRERYRRNPLSASPAVVRLYLAEQSKNYPTSVESAAQFGDKFIYNGDVINDGTEAETVEQVRGIFAHIIPWLK